MTKNAKLDAILRATRAGGYAAAEQGLIAFLEHKFSLKLNALGIRRDTISLNSVNGVFSTRDNKKYFFKFHHEEGEEETLKEYYRAELLEKSGLPVEMPVYVSKEPGEQILIYPYLQHERFFDLCARSENGDDTIVSAEKEFNALCAKKCIETLHRASPDELMDEPILQLFYWRLVEDKKGTPGGRFHRFYRDQDFILPGMTLSYDELANKTWVINGIRYAITLGQAFDNAMHWMAPETLGAYGACIAHGDDHNGNKWAVPQEDGSLKISYFDPAFAGAHIPALLAGVKTLFHDTLAHPLWLYNSKDADVALQIAAEIKGDEIHVRHNWAMSPLRKALFEAKRDEFWAPVTQSLKDKGWLPRDWQEYVRAALFCCPTLVMNLRAGVGTVQNTHTPGTSLLGLSMAIMLAKAPDSGTDTIAEFFKTIDLKL